MTKTSLNIPTSLVEELVGGNLGYSGYVSAEVAAVGAFPGVYWIFNGKAARVRSVGSDDVLAGRTRLTGLSSLLWLCALPLRGGPPHALVPQKADRRALNEVHLFAL